MPPSRILFLVILLLTVLRIKSSAQNVGINTTGATPNAAAILDLNTGNTGTMGFLPEQVALTANNVAAPVVLPPAGLIVYNTATAGAAPNNVIPGYYYWDGAQWQLLLTGSGSTTLAWTVMGNTGITASTSPINTLANNNFIGTTAAADFVLAAKGFERMRIVNGTGYVGVSNIAPTTLMQVGNAATTVGKFSVFSQDAGFGQVQIGNPTANAEASMQFISGVTAFGNPPSSSGGNVNLWNIGAGSYGVGGAKFNIADFAFGPVMTWTSTGLVGVNTTVPQQNLSVNHGLNIDQASGNNGFINNGLVTGDALSFGSGSGEGIADNRNSSPGYEQFGLQFYTGSALAMNISNMTSGTQPG